MSTDAYEPMYSLHDQLVQRMKQQEEACLREVMRKCLGREPVPEDAILFQFVVREGDHDRKGVLYRGQLVGVISRQWVNDETRHATYYRINFSCTEQELEQFTPRS